MKNCKKNLPISFCALFYFFVLSFSPAQAATVDIKNISVVSIKTDSAVIRWDSDEVVGTSQIDYGTSASYGSATTEDRLSYYHEATLSGLNPGTVYHYKIHSKDYDNNETVSLDHTFTTATQAQLDAAFAADIAQRKTQGNVYFVRTDGNDSCSGSQNASYAQDGTNCAFLTISRAVAVAVSGDSVIVMEGDYAVNGDISVTKPNLSVVGHGMPCITQTGSGTGFGVSNADHVTIQGLCIKGMALSASSSPYVTFKDNYVESASACGGTGISASTSSHALISGNRVMVTGNGIIASDDHSVVTYNTADIPDHNNYCEGSGAGIMLYPSVSLNCGPAYNEWNAPQICGYRGSGAQISYNNVLAANRACIAPQAAQDVDIHHNLVDNCNHNGIDFHGTANAKAHSNTILDMSEGDSNSILISAGYNQSDINWSAGGTISLAKNISIYNNYIHNKKAGGIFGWGDPINVTTYNNIIVDEAPGATVSYFVDPYRDYPRICYGLRFIKNRIISNSVTGGAIVINCANSFPSLPEAPALKDISNDSNIFMDNDITVPQGACFDMSGTRNAFYLLNNRYNCSSMYSGYGSVGSVENGYYLNVKAIDEDGNPIPNAQLSIESVKAGYSSYSISGIYGEDGLPTVDNIHRLTPKTSTFTKADGYSPDATDRGGVIALVDKVVDFQTRITQPISWKVTMTKAGYYPRTFYYNVGQDDYKASLGDRTNAKIITLYQSASNKTILGEGGTSWQGNTTLANISEDKVDNHLELNQVASDLSSWWKLDENGGLGASDSAGNNHGIFEGLNSGSSWTVGQFGSSLKLSNSNISIHNDSAFNATDGNTVCMSMWVKPELDWDDTTIHQIVQETGGNSIWGTGQGWDFYKDRNGYNGFNLRLMQSPSYGYDTYWEWTWPWYADTWHFVAFCFDKDREKIWKNDLHTNTQSTGFANPITSPYPIWIGSGGNVSYDDIRLYNRWLSDADMAAIKANTHQSTGTITSSPVSSDNGENWKYITLKGDIPTNTSVSLKLYSSSDGVGYASIILDANAQVNHSYDIPAEYQKKHAYFELTLNTTDLAYTPKISNAILATDGSLTLHTLTITNGTGSGVYEEGSHITITANTPQSGKVFDRWTGDASNVTNVNSATTTVTIPNSAVSLTATYKDISSGGSSGGSDGAGGSASLTPTILKTEIKSITGNLLTLDLNVANASQMMLSDTSSFLGSTWINYNTNPTYTKQLLQTKLYLKFKSSTGIISSTVELTIPPIITNPSTGGDTPNLYPTGTLLKLSDSFKVYVVIEGKKKWIPTPEVFEQLGYKWTEIKILTPTELNTIPDYEDNLIRAINDYKVYLVVNGVKRHIPNPIIFLDYGFKWEEVKDVPQTTIDKYKSTYLIKQSGSSGIYYVNPQEIRKLIPNTEVFNSYNDKNEDIQIISKTEMESYSLSNLIKLNGSNDIYLIEGNIKKRIPNPQVFNKYKLNWNLVMSVNQTEFNFYTDGGELK